MDTRVTTDEQASPWRQVNLTWATWQDAEAMATRHLAPLLTTAEAAGVLTAWWFIRKRETWRLRLLRTPGDATTAFLAHLLATLTEHAALRAYAEVVYEPETRRFGGPQAMDIAHAFFHADSHHVLTHLADTPNGNDHRREIGVRLATRMMTAAGQDLYEQGDVWAAVAEHRTPDSSPTFPSPGTLAAVQTLITAQDDIAASPLTRTPAWPSSHEQAGRALASLAHSGQLTRGLRAVLTDHLLFTFNRLGIPAADQAVLATAASNAVFHHHDHTPAATPENARNAPARPPTVRHVTMHTTPETADPQQLRDALVATIDSLGTFRTSAVKDAFRTVPRHLFLPDVDLPTAYAPKQVVTKRAANGTATSSASSPNIVATMLEQLDVAPGMRVLEIGAATGINAALLAELVGGNGSVVTLELDGDLAEGARTHLAHAGYTQVTVLCRDGALGDPDTAPFDRIIVTAGAWDIATAWQQQLTTGGRLVVPLRLHGSGLTRSLAFTRTTDDHLVSTNAAVCGFVPLRGTDEMGEIHVRLADDAILKIDAEDHPDQDALAKALSYPARQHWTGIRIRHDEPAAHLDLWLATTSSPLNFAKLAAGTTARTLGLANPALRWSGATLYNAGTLAYLTTRPTDNNTDELGLTTHGPDQQATDLATELLHTWSHQRPAQPTITAHPATTPVDQLAPGTRVTRPNTHLTITW
jgi:protein-L-isoaspartate(D-aspartate) O-methyltransferase